MTRDERLPEDHLLWLEEVTGEQALAWVQDHNAATVAALGDEEFDTLRDQILAALDSDERIPYPARRGEWLYNFWRDEQHPKGLWRRTSHDSYKTAEPAWDVLLDLDALAEAEGENWVWGGAKVLYPDRDLALVTLSRGGSDASVVREFDITSRSFVAGGFELPEGKNFVSWAYRDALLVGADFGPDEHGVAALTDSGYPRTARRWERGQPLEEAKIIFAGQTKDVLVHSWADRTPGFEREFVARMLDFHKKAQYELRRAPGAEDGELIEIPVPLDADSSVHEDWIFIRPRSPWAYGGTTHPEGSLLVFDYEQFMDGEAEAHVLFTPDSSTSLAGFGFTLSYLVLETLHDVRSELQLRTLGDWQPAELPGVPPFAQVSVLTTDPDEDDDVFLTATSFTAPSSLLAGSPETGLHVVKQSPAFWDATGVEVRQRFAVSTDGTRIPYFLVGKHLDEARPTILYGYGGFEISMTPNYSPALGLGWLRRGGTYALANIRGGGEYGPSWHTSVLRENRPQGFADFASVASDLVETGATTVAQLGAMGGSNGGLLMGVMATRYPERFGAIVCQVPLTDMLRYHLLLAGASWMAEYGDPEAPADREFLAAYSPYHNVPETGGRTPAMLITTSTKDDRVHPGHARKLAARFEERGHPVLYYENIEGGHGMAADNKQTAFMTALAYRFFTNRLGAR
ncbi:Prolyl oligopeptidase [Segniliparus rotundus DSM 44985]|uniref:Prolyl oligopeptidase n=1 Tax=Segniliparus rotundus (strain ATCC BAA-972 / CDC 1076 / CIP 108378 / DSM 44985 / JCM 13578) TaxID=640132 RepID=D6Z912_SEGRD|nr:prolyl oligopeptidase family serine peptidase [Segniliparus rotundus]ADG98442.1 Prolyl oligopeptidase [Segniliparus rotundus DSM 44985]